MNDGRALTEFEFEAIQKDFFRGSAHDRDIGRVFETVIVQRRVLRKLFALFKQESPLRRVSVADPILNSELAYFKELVSLEDRPFIG